MDSLLFLLPLIAAVGLALYSIVGQNGREQARQRRMDELTDRLVKLYRISDIPARRPPRKRLPFWLDHNLRDLEKNLHELEKHHRVRARRPSYQPNAADLGAVLDNLAGRVAALEKQLT